MPPAKSVPTARPAQQPPEYAHLVRPATKSPETAHARPAQPILII